MAYITVARAVERIEEVKGSRFIAWVSQVDELEAVHVLLEQRRAMYPDASHHCFAYKVGESMRFSDDGEPGGTAGRPMFEVLKKRELDYTLAVVSRYFGGTKLGAGGLVRAYSGSLAKALDEAGLFEVKDREQLRFEVPFAKMDSVYRFLDSIQELSKEQTDYSNQGLILSISLLAEDVQAVKDSLVSLTQGDVSWLERL